MKKQHRASCSFNGKIGIFLLLCCPVFVVAEESDWKIDTRIETGLLTGELEGAKGSFEKYRELRDDGLLFSLKLDAENRQGHYLEFDTRKVGLDDQHLYLAWGKPRQVDLSLTWNKMPHNFSKGLARTAYLTEGSSFRLLSKPISTTGIDVRDWLDTSSYPIDTGMQLGTGEIRLEVEPGSRSKLSVSYSTRRAEGDRAVSTMLGIHPGAYNLVELPSPIDHETNTFELGGEVVGRHFTLALKYTGSEFNNANQYFSWDNPLNPGLDQSCTSEAGYSGTAGTGPCEGRYLLAPDNQSQSLALTATATLPGKTHFSFSSSLSRRTQDDRFLPFTTNDALTTSLISAPSISALSLDGDVRPLVVNATVVSRYFSDMDLKAFYRLYDLDNRTQRIYLEDGYIRQDAAQQSLELLSFPYSYRRQTTGLRMGYDLGHHLDMAIEYRQEDLKKKIRAVPEAKNKYLDLTLDYAPTYRFLLRADYARSERNADDYNAGRKSAIILSETADEIRELELESFRRFDVAKKERKEARLYSQFLFSDRFLVFAGLDYERDRFPDSAAGLRGTRFYSQSVGFDWTYSDHFSLTGDYQSERSDWHLRSLNRSAQFTPEGCSERNLQTLVNCPTSIWASDSDDRVQTLSLGSELILVNDRLNLKIDYSYSHVDNKVSATGNTTTGNSLAEDFPDVMTRWRELHLGITYTPPVKAELQIKVDYYYNRFDSEDFARDVMQPWMGDLDTSSNIQRSVFLGENASAPYRASYFMLGLVLKI